jgi:hypothetical protein
MQLQSSYNIYNIILYILYYYMYNILLYIDCIYECTCIYVFEMLILWLG